MGHKYGVSRVARIYRDVQGTARSGDFAKKRIAVATLQKAHELGRAAI